MYLSRYTNPNPHPYPSAIWVDRICMAIVQHDIETLTLLDLLPLYSPHLPVYPQSTSLAKVGSIRQGIRNRQTHASYLSPQTYPPRCLHLYGKAHGTVTCAVRIFPAPRNWGQKHRHPIDHITGSNSHLISVVCRKSRWRISEKKGFGCALIMYFLSRPSLRNTGSYYHTYMAYF